MQNKTKIIATLGPSSNAYEQIKKLVLAGANVARLNFSHGNIKQKRQDIQYIRQISKELGIPVAIVADLQGPKIRLGNLDGIMHIQSGQKISFSQSASPNAIPIQFDISPFVIPDQRIFINDGLLELKVIEVTNGVVTAEAQNDGWFSSHKGVNIPDSSITKDVFTEKDRQDGEFALAHGVEYLAISFVQTPEDLNPVKALLLEKKANTKIMVKIEKKEAIAHLEKIVEASDAIMVARGDLAIETKAESIPILQQKIISLCRHHQKPVIVATQMLMSMTEKPRPTRAEISDVANAVLSQVDAVMLSEESASGKFPREAVHTMKSIICTVEENPDYKNYIPIKWEHITEENLPFSAIASAAADLSERIKAKAIVVATSTGRTAQLVSSFRPNQQIIAATYNQDVQNTLNLVWGVKPVLVSPIHAFDAFWNEVTNELLKDKLLGKGDKIVLVTGSTFGTSGGTDTIKIATL